MKDIPIFVIMLGFSFLMVFIGILAAALSILILGGI
jgi:hypothetical protein